MKRSIYQSFIEESADDLVSLLNVERRNILNNLTSSYQDKLRVSTKDLQQLNDKLDTVQLNEENDYQIKKFKELITSMITKNKKKAYISQDNYQTLYCLFKDYNLIENNKSFLNLNEIDKDLIQFKGVNDTWLKALDLLNLSKLLLVPDTHAVNWDHFYKLLQNWFTLKNINFNDYSYRLHVNDEISLRESKTFLQNNKEDIVDLITVSKKYLTELKKTVMANLKSEYVKQMLKKEASH